MSEAFRTFALDPPMVARTMRAKLIKTREQLVNAMADGYVSDFPDYRFRCGQINGIDLALAICDEITKEERE